MKSRKIFTRGNYRYFIHDGVNHMFRFSSKNVSYRYPRDKEWTDYSGILYKDLMNKPNWREIFEPEVLQKIKENSSFLNPPILDIVEQKSIKKEYVDYEIDMQPYQKTFYKNAINKNLYMSNDVNYQKDLKFTYKNG